MSNQRNDWHTLADLIAEKVQEYIDEMDAWEKEPSLWVDGNTLEVNLGGEDEGFPGEKALFRSSFSKKQRGPYLRTSTRLTTIPPGGSTCGMVKTSSRERTRYWLLPRKCYNRRLFCGLHHNLVQPYLSFAL